MQALIKYLRAQVGQLMEEKRRGLRNSRSPTEQGERFIPEGEAIPPHGSSSGEEEEGRPYRTRGNNNLDFRVDIPEFEGHLDPDLFLDWLRTVERVFDYKDVSDEKKVKLVALKLRKYASIWWANLVAKRARKGKPKIRSWDQMRDKLKDKFLPSHYLQDNYLKLHHLKQGTKSVEEYTREFEQLLLKCDLREDDSQTLIRYLSGLDEQIANVIELHPYSSLDNLSSLAYKVEQQRKSKGKNPLSKPYTQPYPSLGTPNTFPTPQSTLNPRPPPPTAQTPPQRTHSRPSEKMRCYRCQGLGHIASECPNKRIVTLAEYQASFEEFEEEEKGGKEICLTEPIEEVEEGPDEGELLVIRKVLSGLASPNEFEQREAIFHSRCTIGGKVCSLIIDGGSCANVASQSMVDKLKLEVTPRPKLYTLQWLNEGKGLQVSSQCLLSLSIGKTYQDEVWCDVIPMEACHILLGRPWLFDRKVTYDGYLNTYSFFKDGKKITLAPTQPSHLLTPQKTPAENFLLKPSPKTNQEVLSLRTNSKQAGEYDGDHPPKDHTILREGGGNSKEAEEVQDMARNPLKQSNSAHGTSPGN